MHALSRFECKGSGINSFPEPDKIKLTETVMASVMHGDSRTTLKYQNSEKILLNVFDCRAACQKSTTWNNNVNAGSFAFKPII